MEPYHEERYTADLSSFQREAQSLMEQWKKGPDAFKSAVATIIAQEGGSEKLAGIYHYLHNEGGLGKLDTGFMDQIRSGALGLRNPEYIRATIALRVLMDEYPGAHESRIGMVKSPHAPVDPSKYKGGSPMIHKYMGGEESMSESKNSKTRIIRVIKEEIQAVLDQEK
tara:strand:+ start:383 stop:886 length:504 start_codon:yes stop_codon:yes gene_type:complete